MKIFYLIMTFSALTISSIFSQQQEIDSETTNLKNLHEKKDSLIKIKSELNLIGDGAIKDELKEQIEKIESDIIEKKATIYDLRITLPANNKESISTVVNTNEKENQINAYNSLVAEVDSYLSALPSTLNEEQEQKKEEQKELKSKYEEKIKDLEKLILKEKAKIFDEFNKVYSRELPFNLTDEQRANPNNDPLINQQINVNEKVERIIINEKSKKALKNTKITYAATIYNTNFSVPVARFNFSSGSNREGEVVLFNSIGAGFGKSWGRLEETRGALGELTGRQFRNTFSIHGGVLFSASGADNATNIFAPTISFGLLDFQVGVGYELGTLTETQSPFFVTVSYAIPLYKLTKTKFFLLKKSKVINEVTTI